MTKKHCSKSCDSCTCESNLETFEELWRKAVQKGTLLVQDRKDERGPYVRVKTRQWDGTILECSAATVPAALRAIVAYGTAYQVEMLLASGEWRSIPDITFSNEIAAEKEMKVWKHRHPAMQFRVVKA